MEYNLYVDTINPYLTQGCMLVIVTAIVNFISRHYHIVFQASAYHRVENHKRMPHSQ